MTITLLCRGCKTEVINCTFSHCPTSSRVQGHPLYAALLTPPLLTQVPFLLSGGSAYGGRFSLCDPALSGCNALLLLLLRSAKAPEGTLYAVLLTSHLLTHMPFLLSGGSTYAGRSGTPNRCSLSDARALLWQERHNHGAYSRTG